MTKADVWTVPHSDAWANRREGAKRASKVFATKAEAQAAVRKTAMRSKVLEHPAGELVELRHVEVEYAGRGAFAFEVRVDVRGE
jgi:hypothetical protein